MQLADPTRGRSQPRVRACKVRAKPELQGPHFLGKPGSDFREGRLCPRHKVNTRPHPLRDLAPCPLFPASDTPTHPLSDRQEVGKGCVLHGV